MRLQRVLERIRRTPTLAFAGLAVLLVVVAVAIHARRAVVFEVTPASFPECEGPNIVAHVAWDASRVAKDHVLIFTYKMGNRPKLWSASPVKGEADTGKWVADGSTVELVDDQNRVLAKRTMQSTPCERGISTN